jgi:aryl-alcohol dehydrogenase-like predicted oxidoreductase
MLKSRKRTAGEVALAWTLANPAVTGAIVGLRNASQVEGVKGALEFRLSADEVREIEDFQRAGAAGA